MLKKIGIAVIFIFIALVTGSYLYVSRAYPQTAPLIALTYLAESIITPHTKLDKHVMGFMPFWQVDNSKYVKPEHLSEINYFSITATGDGSLLRSTAEPGWQGWEKEETQNLLTEARIKGTDVTVTVAILDAITIEELLGSPLAQDTFVQELTDFINENNLDGVTIDFEYIDIPSEAMIDQFTNLSTKLRESIGDDKTMSLAIMPRAVRDPDIFDYEAIEPLYDRFIGMSYEYYPGINEFSAPIAPMTGIESNYFFDVTTTYEDYISVLPKEKIVMGIPYYGWERAVEDGPTEGSYAYPVGHPNHYAAVMSYGRARESKDIKTEQCTWQEVAMETWCWYTDKETGIDHQAWIADNKSINVRFKFAKEKALGGIAIWTLGYDKDYPDLWDMISTLFTKS